MKDSLVVALYAVRGEHRALCEEAGERIEKLMATPPEREEPTADTMIGVRPDGSRLLNDAPSHTVSASTDKAARDGTAERTYTRSQVQHLIDRARDPSVTGIFLSLNDLFKHLDTIPLPDGSKATPLADYAEVMDLAAATDERRPNIPNDVPAAAPVQDDLIVEIKETMALEIGYQRTWNTLKKCRDALQAQQAADDRARLLVAKLEAECDRLRASVRAAEAERDEHRECWITYKRRMDVAESALARAEACVRAADARRRGQSHEQWRDYDAARAKVELP